MGKLRSVVAAGAAAACLLTAGCGGTDDSGSARTGSTSAASPGASREQSPAASGVADRVAALLKTDPVFDQVRAVIVTVGGKTILEKYYDTTADVHRNIYSMTKSVMATLVGIAVGEKLIPGGDATLAELLPKYAKTMPRTVATTTLKQVLTMRAGFPGEDDPNAFAFLDAKDPTQAILDSAAGHRTGKFLYSPAGAHLASVILATATGRSVLDYARSRLFAPLRIDTTPVDEPIAAEGYSQTDPVRFTWARDRQGHHAGWSELALTPSDLSKIGNLYLHSGRVNGTQVLPADWVRAATKPQVAVPGLAPGDDYYGYEWWSGDLHGQREYSAVGFGGQRVMVFPASRAVVVVVVDAYIVSPDSGISPAQSGRIAEEAVSGLTD
jgi:CubicO group peptidase (beta-lactamase class C family)